MSTLVLMGDVTFFGDAPLHVRVSAGGASVEAPVREDGSFRIDVPIPEGASAPDPAALEQELDALYELADEEPGAVSELFRQLGGVAPATSEARRALGLHALAQGEALLEAWGAGPAAEAWLNASLDVLAGSETLAHRALHLSQELAGHSIAVDVEVLVGAPNAAPELADPPGDWREALDELWSKCDGAPTKKDKIDWPILRMFSLPKKKLARVLEPGDWLKTGRTKFPHRYGVVGKVSWIARAGHPFTGIFASGAEGLVRLGSGLNNVEYTIPGLALKLPVTGRSSRDIAALYRAEGQGSDGDFFRNALHTRVPPPSEPANTDRLAAWAFAKGQDVVENRSEKVLKKAERKGCPRRLPLEHLAAVTQDGVEVSDPRAPFELVLEPTLQVKAAFEPPPSTGAPRLLEQLAKLPAPLPLYTVFGIEREPTDERWEIGELRLETPLVRSLGGDLQLHFQHYYPSKPA